MFKYWMYKIGSFFVNSLPWELSYRLGDFLSDVHYFFSFRDRQLVKNNLKAILGEREDVSFQAREVFRNFGRYLVEFFRMEKIFNSNFIKVRVKVCDAKNIDKALAKGKGGIILTAHMGNWELGGVVITSLGYSVTAIALPHKERPVNELFNRQRQIKGMTVVPMQNSVRKSIEALKSNGLVAVLADRDFTSHGELLDFLGKKALIPKGAAIFSIKTGAPLIPVFFMRQPDNTFILEIEEPIDPPEINEEMIEGPVLINFVEKYKKIIEDRIRRSPTQWLMFRKFWVE